MNGPFLVTTARWSHPDGHDLTRRLSHQLCTSPAHYANILAVRLEELSPFYQLAWGHPLSAVGALLDAYEAACQPIT